MRVARWGWGGRGGPVRARPARPRAVLVGALLATLSVAGPLTSQQNSAGTTGPAPGADTAWADTASAGTVIGTVVGARADSPVAGARISVRGRAGEASPAPVVTDHDGRFRLAGVSPGARVFEVELPGLPSTTFRADVRSDGPTELALRVETRLVPQPAIAVRVTADGERDGKLAGFYRRRARGLGRFMDREEIENRRALEVSDLLRSMPGVVVTPGPGSTGEVAMSRSSTLRAHRGCRIVYFVDGIRVPPADGFRPDELSPGDLAGIEVYRSVSEVPAIFLRTGEECGVIALWTRDPSRRP